MSLNQSFEKGLSFDEYIQTFENEKRKDIFFNIYENFTLPEDDDFFQLLQDNDLRVLVLAESWCGHCALNIPVLLHLSEKGKMPVRILPRDENLGLMDQYLTNDKRIIPIFVFINSKGDKIARWGPMSSFTKEFVDKLKEKLPEKDSPEFTSKQKELFEKISNDFRDNDAFWYASYHSIKETLKHRLK